MSRSDAVVYVSIMEAVHDGPRFVGWRTGRTIVARRADLRDPDPVTDTLYGRGPGTWRGVLLGAVPVEVIEDPSAEWPVPSLDQAWIVHAGRPCPPAPRFCR